MLTPDLESTSDSTLLGIAYALRPHQWYKQVILFIPLVYSGRATEPSAWATIALGALLFSVTAGCVYVLNDVFDREEDRDHPVKRHRPIASGQVPVGTATLVAVGGFLASGLLAFRLDHIYVTVLVAYVLLNVAYSSVLKQVFLIDMFVIGIGFVLRAYAGVALLDAPFSSWLFLTVFLAAFLLASGKRHSELVANDESEVRSNLDDFTADFSLFVLYVAASTLIVIYSLYTFFARQTEMMLTIPFAYYSVLRFSHLVLLRPTEQVHELLFQRDMLANFVLWGVVTVFILYVLSPV